MSSEDPMLFIRLSPAVWVSRELMKSWRPDLPWYLFALRLVSSPHQSTVCSPALIIQR